MNTLYKTIDSFVQKNNLITPNDKVVLALSGGPDSVFLFHYLLKLHTEKKISLITAHVDHQWRDNSKDDALFCKQLSTQHGIPFFEATLADITSSRPFNGSQEEYARNARRTFFEQLAQDHDATAIALGHHAQDQQETFFIRLLRGASLSGMIGIKPKDGLYVRPLLCINKTDIVEYLHNNNLSYCIDQSNDSMAYLRNRIRHKVIPALIETDSRFEKTFKNTLSRLTETEEFLAAHTVKLFDEMSEYQEGKYIINSALFAQQHTIMQQRLIVHWLCKEKVPFAVSESFFDEIIRFIVYGRSRKHHISQQWSLSRAKQKVHIART